MEPSSRDRITVDLHGLKAALFDRAQTLGVSPSGLVRSTLADALCASDTTSFEQPRDERGQTMRGKDAVREVADDWRFGGTLIDDVAEPGHRREAFNIMLSMPRGTDPLAVQRAAREFVKVELADHKVAMVLHDHQANPHVHISVRAESKHGKRLNPRKADLHRWRETFAERLRELGIDAEATRQATRGRNRSYEPLWRLKAREEGRPRTGHPGSGKRPQALATRAAAAEAWMHVGRALAVSGDAGDRALARSIAAFVKEMALARSPERPAKASDMSRVPTRDEIGPSR